MSDAAADAAGHPGTDAHANEDEDGYVHRDPYADGDQDPHSDADAYGHSDPNADSDLYANTDSNPDVDIHPNPGGLIPMPIPVAGPGGHLPVEQDPNAPPPIPRNPIAAAVTNGSTWWQYLAGVGPTAAGAGAPPVGINEIATLPRQESNALAIGTHLPWVYGTMRLAGRIVGFIQNGTPNVDYVYVVICKGEIDSVTEFLVDGIAKTVNGTSGGITSTIYTGTLGQSPDAVAVSLGYTPFNVTGHPSHVYARIDFDYNVIPSTTQPRSYYAGIEFAFTVKGFKVYDHRVPTTAWRENPAVCIRDYLIRSGLASGASAINETVFDAQADLCDDDIGGDPRFRMGAALIQRQSARTWLDAIRMAGAADVFRHRGKWEIRVGTTQTVDAMTFRDGVNAKNVTLRQSPRRERPGSVRIGFPNKDYDLLVGNPYQPDSVVAETPEDAALPKVEYQASSINDPVTAKRVAWIYRNRAKFPWGGALVTWTPGSQLLPGARVRLLQDAGGIDQIVLPTGLNHLPNGETEVTFVQYDDGIFEDSAPYTGATLPGVSTAEQT